MEIDKDTLEKMVSRMVHDVRTPLTVLNMVAYQLAQQLKDNQNLQEELRMMQEELPKIEKIVSEYRENFRKIIAKDN